MESNIINQNNFVFDKKFGQNFIFDKNLLQAIVTDSKITQNDEILEIGSGAGTLTKIICQNAKFVVSYEIDKRLKPILQQNLQDETNCNLVFKDALKTPISEIEDNFNGNYKIVANLPYYITTPLIFKFIEQSNRVISLTLMVQKEVAQRMTAKCGTAEYGTISAILNFYGNVKILRNVSKNMFMPKPKVDSCVVQIELIKNKFSANAQNFINVVHAAFAMRRKTLANNLCSAFNFSRQEVEQALLTCNLNLKVRGEELDAFVFNNLTNALFDKKNQVSTK